MSFSLPAAIVGLTSSCAASSCNILFTSGTAGDTIFYGLSVFVSDFAWVFTSDFVCTNYLSLLLNAGVLFPCPDAQSFKSFLSCSFFESLPVGDFVSTFVYVAA